MERVKSLIGPSFAQNLAESNKVAAEEFASTIDKARTNRGAIDMKAGSRTISDATIAAGTRAVARAPKSGVDQFFQKYHYRYIKSGRAMPLVHLTLVVAACGIYLEHKHHSLTHAHH